MGMEMVTRIPFLLGSLDHTCTSRGPNKGVLVTHTCIHTDNVGTVYMNVGIKDMGDLTGHSYSR